LRRAPLSPGERVKFLLRNRRKNGKACQENLRRRRGGKKTGQSELPISGREKKARKIEEAEPWW